MWPPRRVRPASPGWTVSRRPVVVKDVQSSTVILEPRAPEARIRGAPLLASAALVVADPGVPRTTYLLRLVSAEMRNRSSVLLADFGGAEGEVLAGTLRAGQTILIDADARDGVFPLGGFHALGKEAREAAGEVLAEWFRPHGHLAESNDVRAALGLFARLPILLPRSGLYLWRRYIIDRPFRRDCIRALQREGVDPSPLLAAHPGTMLWRVLVERADKVLGHDDTIDRIFPVARPEALVEASEDPELRIVQCQSPWSPRSDRYRTLLWLHLLTALAVRPGRRKDDRSPVERFVLVDPPRPLWQTAKLLAAHGETGLRVTLVTADVEPDAPPERWFGRAPAVIFQRSSGWKRLGLWGDLTSSDARRLHAREAGSTLLYVNQRGAPIDRWCTLDPQSHMPEFLPEALVGARRLARSRFLIERATVVENRRRIEAHAERVRHRAGTNDLLDRAIRIDRLTAAWRRTHRNKGVPGVDRVSVELFSERWQERLSSLQGEVRAVRYRPQPYLRVLAEKESGGQRPMSIPSVIDRVLMGAAADVLSGVLEPHFSDRSFAYRPGRSARGAVSELLASTRIAGGWAIIADIASYFDSIDHRLLLGMLREHVADEAFLRLITSWITNMVLDGGQQVRPRRGVPQGAPISPILANLYLTPLDRWMESRGLDYVRYADDFIALCDSEVQARKITAALEEFLARELDLSVKPSKTSFVQVAEGFEFLGFAIEQLGARIPETRLVEARRSVALALKGEGIESRVLTDLDAYVRGFRNYFDLGVPRITEQLEMLEADRRQQLVAWARARRLDLSLVIDRSERFVVETAPSAFPGAYAQEQPARTEEEAAGMQPVVAQATSLAEVDRRPAAVRARVAAGRPAAVNAGGHLEIFGFGALASLEEERLVLRRKQELIFEAPLGALRTIQVDSYGMVLTTPLLEKLAEHDIPVLFTRHGERPWAVLRPLLARSSVDLLRAQVAAQAGALGIEVAKELVAAKLVNQERLLRYYAKYKRRRSTPSGQSLRDSADRIARIADELSDDSLAEPDAARRKIFSIEGRAAGAYWAGLREVLGTQFPGRVGQRATDPVNVALNYGYGILYAATWGAIARAGLEPGIGMLHASPGDRGALVFDLVEPFRVPAVDRPVAGLISRGRIIKLNTDGHLTASARSHIAGAVGRALHEPVPWGGVERPLSDHMERQARDLAIWLQGGKPMRALRIRW